jgi:excinuclease ABC subunit C
MSTGLQKIELSAKDKELLEAVSGKNIWLRNISKINQKEIRELQTLAVQNAQIYLQRNRLGQKLSIFEENNLYQNLLDLQKLLGLKKTPRRIECYDISHLSGTFVYGSMVTFLDAVAAKKFYRLFKCPNRNDDFANHYEVLKRRLKRGLNQAQNVKLEIDNQEEVENSTEITKVLKKDLEKQILKAKKDIGWQLPDLIIVDGGKGQLSSDFKALQEFGLQDQIDLVGLAKKEEEIFVLDYSKIDKNAKFGKEGGVLLEGSIKFLIQRIRDEAHRFAITNNRKAKLKTAQKSQLDKVPGIGEKTKFKLLQIFGSTENIVENLFKNPEIIYETVGKKVTENLKKFFGVI